MSAPDTGPAPRTGAEPRTRLERTVAGALIALTRLLTGVRARWEGCAPAAAPRIYFANHASHGDFVLVWSSLPPALRRVTRPVAGADYWTAGRLRRFCGERVFRAVLIDRGGGRSSADPIALMAAALDAGQSLILFPEGTRNTTDADLLPFRTGLFHLAAARRHVELVPVWIENIGRVMPKGEIIPVPLLCSVTFGSPIHLGAEESKPAFLARARNALLALGTAGETATS